MWQRGTLLVFELPDRRVSSAPSSMAGDAHQTRDQPGHERADSAVIAGDAARACAALDRTHDVRAEPPAGARRRPRADALAGRSAAPARTALGVCSAGH